VETRCVLLVGSSQLQYAESPDRPSIATLTCRRLGELDPSTRWEASTVLAYPLPNMPGHTRAALEAAAPDFVVLFLGTSTVAEPKVVYAIRRRSRRLAALAGRMSRGSLTAAGDGTEGSASARGLLFRFPRALARLLFGEAPLVSLEVALDAVRSTIAVLNEAMPGRCLVVLSSGAPQSKHHAARVAATIRAFNESVVESAAALGVPVVDPVGAVKDAGVSFDRPDGVHAGFEARRALGRTLADAVLALREAEAAGRHLAPLPA
jgi:hypothetical protein